ncbi:MAG TPA: hypothetical protein VIX20_12580 [Ktedonobacteraceae bacterium]
MISSELTRNPGNWEQSEEDFEALRKTGYSEDAIFELTVSAALGTGISRLEHGLAVLKGDEE